MPFVRPIAAVLSIRGSAWAASIAVHIAVLAGVSWGRDDAASLAEAGELTIDVEPPVERELANGGIQRELANGGIQRELANGGIQRELANGALPPGTRENEVAAPRSPHVDATHASRSTSPAPVVPKVAAAPTAVPVASEDPLHSEVAAAPAPAPQVDAQSPHFSMVVTGDDAEPAGAKSAPASAPRDAAQRSAASAPARLLSSGATEYPSQARAVGIEADVLLEILVDAAGKVVGSTLLRAAGHGFDESAQRAIRTYRFTPARRDGVPVAVRMPWTVAFRLQ